MGLGTRALSKTGHLVGAASLAVFFATPTWAQDLMGQPTPGGIDLQPAASPLKHEAIFFHDVILMPIIVGICLAASAASFVMMSIDKQRATQRRRRIPEQTLHLLELAGGWPGSLAAQHIIRHKNRKVAYQVPFYFCVVLNCGFLLWMAI